MSRVAILLALAVGDAQAGKMATLRPAAPRVARQAARVTLAAEHAATAEPRASPWSRQWLPAMPVSYADPTRPNACTLLGERLVIWKGATGWAAAEDACPHRLAPLSTGAVRADGTLACRFHGWRFDERGACVDVPSAPSPALGARLCASADTCVRSFPVAVRAGLVWVWLESGAEGAARAAATAVPALEGEEKLSWELNVQPISFESMVENSLDPSHAPFLHAGLGSFGATAGAIPMERPAISTKPSAEGFEMRHGGYDVRTAGMNATRRFAAPSLVDVRYAYRTGRATHFPIHFVPAAPFETRVLVGIQLPSVPRWVPERVRAALGDALHVLFFALDGTWRFNDQDRFTMAGQDSIQAEQPRRRQLAFDMATPSDVGVSTFRRWLALVGGGPFAAAERAAGSARPGSPNEALSRWDAHGRHCPRCRAAMRRFERARALGERAALASTALAVLALAVRSPAFASTAAAALALHGLARVFAGWQRSMLGRPAKEAWLEEVFQK
ncbi:hypothetical protein KFE25_011732 [Diacronema lutheri]|uniref:Rieske domain-containing protein n=1 Tax=Diacronema lutheri TaxID=2081491 RepID=A0A8J5X1A2_DIALT|nr:hypothetical protein KFE25_011732 [Diacronema lutheri]